MNIVIVMRYAVPIHAYREIVRACGRRRHNLYIIFDRQWSGTKPTDAVEELKREAPSFSYEWALHRTDIWRHLVFPVRQLQSWRRYFFVNQSSFFRDRWMHLFPSWLRVFVHIPGMRPLVTSAWGGRMLERMEGFAPAARHIVDQLKSLSPDAVVMMVANMRYGSIDTDYMRAARAIGVRLFVLNPSWDSLTTKGVISVMPDAAFVWNETQAAEAEEHHHIPRSRTRIIGAPPYDKWFRFNTQSEDRRAFCAQHGLRDADPVLLYVGSSGNIAGDETWILPQLREVLDRSGDDRLQKTQIIVRPHPAHAEIYHTLQLHDTIILPKQGEAPDTPQSLQLFYDCMRYSFAVTGLYTSAMIDSLIMGRPVVALLREEYRKTQEEAQYFKHVIESGAILTARSMEQLAGYFGDLLNGIDIAKSHRDVFVARYIRPFGRDVAASDKLVEELEKIV